jgi:hypothetical protein
MAMSSDVIRKPKPPATRFNVDSGVKAREKESTWVDSSSLSWFISYVLPVFIPTAIFIVLPWLTGLVFGFDYFGTLPTNTGFDTLAFILLVTTFFTIVAAALCRSHSKSNPRDYLIIKRELRTQLREAKRAAKLVDATVLPVLTIEHVDARARVDGALLMESIRQDSFTVWDQTDADKIAALLFKDLSREHTILNLINVRSMITYAEISEALAGMEANGKALQEGWL